MTTKTVYEELVTRNLRRLADYRGVVTDGQLDEIRDKAAGLKGAKVAHVNATNYGGGVAEILNNLVLLMNDLGISTDWRVLHGTPDFFEVTKKFHNALQGDDVHFTDVELALYEFTNSKFAHYAMLDQDFVIIHDPQPLALARFAEHTAPWVWRCHIDITHPNSQAWEFIHPYVEMYERMVVSSEIYRNEGFSLQQDIISPSIDPLSSKNIELPDRTVFQTLKDHDIPTDKPLITQVSRFDPWKDPEGVLEVFKRVKEEVDCRLVYCYNIANDDPEAVRIYNDMYELAKPYLESGEVLFVRGDDPILVNVLQRVSSVILQKSTREGFGLTVTEAMWKRTPVVASDVGGIPTQMVDGVTGYLVDPQNFDQCADRVVTLLQDESLREELGHQAQEHVRQHFLITRHLLDYLTLLLDL
ncbi:MAG: glycosyltransferase [Anaerolineales bacterium]